MHISEYSPLLIGVVMSAKRRGLERILFESRRGSRENYYRARALLNFLIKSAIIAYSIGLTNEINPWYSYRFARDLNKLIKEVSR